MTQPSYSLLGEIMQDTRLPAARTIEWAWKLRRLTTLVHRHLPASARPHCVVANLRGGTLILLADSPAWSARLRYQAAQLRQALARETGLALTGIRVQVSPRGQATEPATAARPHLSQANARLLDHQADATDHPGLAAALRRLARRRED